MKREIIFSLAGIGILLILVLFNNPINKIQKDSQQELIVQGNKSSNLELQPYVNLESGFKIYFPKGWEVDESHLLGTHVIFKNYEMDREGVHQFQANITIISEGTTLSLEEYINSSKNFLPKFFQDYKFVEEKYAQLENTSVKMIGGTFIQGVYPLRNLQMVVVKDDRAYIITGTVLHSTWENYKTLIETSLLTFQIL